MKKRRADDMSLKDIFCQNRAITFLQRAYAADRTAQAYIFAGAEGIGRFKTAGQWARLLLCETPNVDTSRQEKFADSCGQCKSCRLFDAGSHPDFHHVYKELREFTRDGKGKGPPVDMPIDVIREFVIEKVAIRPTFSTRSVFVIGEAEKLNASSQNSLLKVLEEPPAHCCLILLCTRLDKLLATTRSRCQTVRFGPIDEERIIETLTAKECQKDRAQYFARLADGSLGLACTLAQLEGAGADLYAIKTSIVKAMSVYRLPEALQLAGSLCKAAKSISTSLAEIEAATSKTDINRRAGALVISIVASVFRDVMMSHVSPPRPLVNSDQKQHIDKLAGRMCVERASEAVADCYRMVNWIESNVNEKLIFEQLLLSIARSDRIPA